MPTADVRQLNDSTHERFKLDVTNDDSVAAAADTIAQGGGLDVLVNNVGIQVEMTDDGVIGAADLTADMMRATFESNVFGMVRVLHAFLPLLLVSAAPLVVNVSSALASLTRVSTPGTAAFNYPGVAYPASKTAVNMLTVQYAKQLPSLGVNAVEPGFTRTDLNRKTGTNTLAHSAEIIVRMALLGRDGPTGGYYDTDGELPW